MFEYGDLVKVFVCGYYAQGYFIRAERDQAIVEFVGESGMNSTVPLDDVEFV